MKLIINFSLLFFINFIFSQDYKEATIIFNDSTSVKGFGEIKNNTIYFKVKQEDKPSKWSYDIAKGLVFSGYGYSEKYEYVKFEKNRDPRIMEVMEEGKLFLYKYSNLISNNGTNLDTSVSGKMPNHMSGFENFTETFYVKRKDAKLALDITFSFKSRARIYFSDCEKIIEKINSGKFTKKNIPEMIYYYNDYCDENEN